MIPVYCITMDPNGARAQRTVQEFQKYGITPIMSLGFDGYKSGLKSTVEMHHNDGYPYFIGPHHMGTTIAHLMMWHHLVTAKVPEAIIVQDDVKLCQNFLDEFQKSYAELPADWEYVWVGHCCAADRPANQVTPRVWNIRWPMCDHCILLKLSAAEKMLTPMNEFRAPVDVALIDNVFSKGLVKAYTFQPRQAEQYDTMLPY